MADTIDHVAAKLAEARDLLAQAHDLLRQTRPTSPALPIITEGVEAVAQARALVPYDR